MEHCVEIATVIRQHKQWLMQLFAVYRAFDKQKCNLVFKLKSFDTDS